MQPARFRKPVGLVQARQLIRLLEEHGRDFTSCSMAFEHWCARNIKPWFDDHVSWDADLIRRWSGQDVDLTRPLPSDLIMAAVQADPERQLGSSLPLDYV